MSKSGKHNTQNIQVKTSLKQEDALSSKIINPVVEKVIKEM